MQAAPQMARKPEAFNMSELSPLTYSIYSYLTSPAPATPALSASLSEDIMIPFTDEDIESVRRHPQWRAKLSPPPCAQNVGMQKEVFPRGG